MMIFGPSKRDAGNPQANPARLVNLYREPGDRTLLRSVQGLSARVDAKTLNAGDMLEVRGKLYAIFGGKLFDVTTTADYLAAVNLGEQIIAHNAERVTIVSAGQYLVWDDGLEAPGPGAFTEYGSVTYLAGRTVLSELNGNRIQWSDIDDPYTLNGLNFASAEQRPDNVVRVLAANGTLMVFGEASTEIWGVTGQGGASAFQLIPGAVVDTGLKAAKLAVGMGNGVFLVGDDDIAYLAVSTQWQPVSIPAVNVALKTGQPTRCIYWEDYGHKFCAVIFADRPAWVYDLATQEWFERAEGQYGAWDIGAGCSFGASWAFAGNDGIVYSAVNDGTDKGGVLYREATSGLIEQNGEYFTVNSIEFGAAHGFQPIEVELMLETSRDGATWSRAGAVSIGFDGDFNDRAVFRRIGRSRKRAFRLSMAAPCDFALYADANVK